MTQGKLLSDLLHWCNSADYWLSKYKCSHNENDMNAYRERFEVALNHMEFTLRDLEKYGVDTFAFRQSVCKPQWMKKDV